MSRPTNLAGLVPQARQRWAAAAKLGLPWPEKAWTLGKFELVADVVPGAELLLLPLLSNMMSAAAGRRVDRKKDSGTPKADQPAQTAF